MDFKTLLPFLAPLIRHGLTAFGGLELSRATDASDQAAAALVTLIGLGWSIYNAHASRKQQNNNQQQDTNP